MIISGKSCQQTARQTLIFVADNKNHLLIKMIIIYLSNILSNLS